MAECDNCGAFVSGNYRRVFEADGVLDGCQHCQERKDHGGNLI